MPVLLQRCAIFCLLLLGIFSAARGQVKALPLDSPAPAAVLDVLTFNIRSDGEEHKLVVTPTPTLLRVDAPDDGLSVIYETSTQHYYGLENRNYTYWEFSWPEVRAAVQGTKRYETRLREVGADIVNPPVSTPDSSLPNGDLISTPSFDTNAVSTTPPTPAPPTADDSPPASDDSGYTWNILPDKKRIAGLECQHWSGQSLSGDPVDAWCYPSPLPKILNAVALLREINEPMALVPVREIVPPFVFEVWNSLLKGGSTPVVITWGDEHDKNHFELLSLKTRQGRADLFTVPRLYVKTTLITMDGIGGQKAPGGVIPANGNFPQKPARLP